MELPEYLKFQRAELARMEDALTCVNLAVQTRDAMIVRGDFQRRIKSQRQAIAIVERSIASAA